MDELYWLAKSQQVKHGHQSDTGNNGNHPETWLCLWPQSQHCDYKAQRNPSHIWNKERKKYTGPLGNYAGILIQKNMVENQNFQINFSWEFSVSKSKKMRPSICKLVLGHIWTHRHHFHTRLFFAIQVCSVVLDEGGLHHLVTSVHTVHTHTIFMD